MAIRGDTLFADISSKLPERSLHFLLHPSSACSPRLTTIIDTIATAPMGNYSFETVQELFNTFDEWRRDSQCYDDCKDVLEENCPGATMPAKPPAPVDTYGIYVGFDRINDKKKREYFLNMPTSFSLKKEEVDDLRTIGPEILDDSGEFQRLLEGLQATAWQTSGP